MNVKQCFLNTPFHFKLVLNIRFNDTLFNTHHPVFGIISLYIFKLFKYVWL